MLNGIYNGIKNAHAFNQLSKQPEIMGAETGMDNAESRSSIPIKIRPNPAAQSPKIETVRTMDDTMYTGTGAQVKPTDFPKFFYMGEDY